MDLACIGFDTSSPEQLRALLERLAGEADDRLSTRYGEYAIWRSRSGAELWFHLAEAAEGSDEREIIGLTPFFEGRSELTVRIEEFQPAADTPFEGTCRSRMTSGKAESGTISYHIVDAAAWRETSVESPAVVRLTAFATRLSAPSGATGEAATVTGPIEMISVLRNEASGQPFACISLACDAGTIDVVAPLSVAKCIAVGDVISASGTLVGRVLE